MERRSLVELAWRQALPIVWPLTAWAYGLGEAPALLKARSSVRDSFPGNLPPSCPGIGGKTAARRKRWRGWSVLALVGLAAHARAEDFEISITDAATGRGVPMVELETVNHLQFVTDSAGLMAIHEPDLEGSRVFFRLSAPGYQELPADAAGVSGIVLPIQSGKSAAIPLQRLNLAERLYRLTGTGIYAESIRLGKPAPLAEPLVDGGVAGQDAMSAALFRGRLYWFAGDTLRLRHPLGQYWTTGASSELPEHGGLDPALGVNLHYFVDAAGFARAMWPAPPHNQGVIWTDGLLTVRDADGQEQLLAHFTHLQSAGEMIAHGLGLFDPVNNQFVPCDQLPPEELWRFPNSQPTLGRSADEGFYLFPAPLLQLTPFPAVRAPADLASLRRPESYLAFTCLDPQTNAIERGADGNVRYDWKPGLIPLSPRSERALITTGALREEEALYQIRDVETHRLLEFRSGSVHWNSYRRKWIMIAELLGPNGYTGEIYYAEAAAPVGPWRLARKILTHGPMSFYNPVQHPFFDQEGGRFIFFEGTFAATTPGIAPLPRYDDNQIMYRLDLADERLHLTP